MNKISNELKKQISCKVIINYGRDKDGHEDIEKVKQICCKYDLNTIVFNENRYCTSDYKVLRVTGEISLISLFNSSI